MNAFVREHVEPGATVITDGWSGYQCLTGLGYAHQPRSQRAARARGENIDKLLPGVHRIASLAKRWLLSTHKGAAVPEHLPSYLNEFVFRFNRRPVRNQGLLFYRAIQLAVAHDPVRYEYIIATKRLRETMPKSPGVYSTPPSLERRRASRPWRRTLPISSG